ncbi:MAG: amylo-alpha-1,6-glucosidase [Alphaproteobacteria bacterium]|nr:amylo-alpha-1,6-glucosidase [Alphaproteobacteria bacterium]
MNSDGNNGYAAPAVGPAGDEASPFYIESNASLQERRPRPLKSGYTFALFDRRGDIVAARGNSDGIYLHDTRFLSHLELRLNGSPMLLLSSNVQEDNAVLTVDLANPELVSRDGTALRGELIHVNRLKYVWQNACYERLLVHNFDTRGHDVRLGIRFAADFADLFEVRGLKRARRGQISVNRRSDSCVVLRYLGLDGVERFTSLEFEPAPTRLDAATALYELSLAPGEGARCILRIACRDDNDGNAGVGRQFYSSLRTARRALRTSSGRAASIDASNSLFNEFARRSVADLYMLLTETKFGPYPFAGIPWFSTPFGRDGILTALFALWLDPSIARGVMRFLAATQSTDFDAERDAEPGKILHEMRDGEMARLREVPFARYYGSVDATPLFVVLAGEYFKRTGDLDTVRELWPNIEAALNWIDTYGDPDGDGFVEYQRKNADGLINQGWKDSNDAIFHEDGRLAEGPIALCEVQAYVYGAKRHAAALALALDHSITAATLAHQAEVLRERFEAAFWCDDIAVYALALDGAKRPCRVVSSNAGHTLLTGIAGPERAALMADTLLGSSCFSGWGIRTVARSAARYNPISYHNGSVWPHDNAIITLGLSRYGLKSAVLRVFKGLFQAAGYMDLRRLPELFCGFAWRGLTAPTLYPVACTPQAWASATVFALLQASLGLSFDRGGEEIRYDRPVLPDFLDQLHLRRLQARHGIADVLLRRYGAEVSVDITRRQGAVPIVIVR